MSELSKYRTYYTFRKEQTLNDEFYDHVAIDGGNYSIPKEKLVNKLTNLINANATFSSLVPVIREASLFFMDVDKLTTECCINKVLSAADAVIAEKFGEQAVEKIITKNESLEKYHVYYTQVVVKKQILKPLWFEINKRLKNNALDLSCTALRYDGFVKFNKHTRSYELGTRYFRQDGGQLDIDFFNVTYLPRKNADCTALLPKNSSQHSSSSQYSKYSQDSDRPSSQSSIVNTNSAFVDREFENKNDESKIENDVHQQIINDYPHLQVVLQQHKLISRKIYAESNVEVFGCSKTKADRTCPFSDRVHRSNNLYFVYNKNKDELIIKCHHAKCQKKGNVVFSSNTRDPFIEKEFDEEIIEGCPVTDTDFAELFAEMYPNWMFNTNVPTKKECGSFFEFNGKFWVWDKNQMRLKTTISKHFRQRMKELMDEKIEKESRPVVVKKLRQIKERINKHLGNARNIANVRGLLQVELYTEAELDTNDDITVLKNGIFDISTFSFRNSLQEEMVTTLKQTRFEFSERDEEGIERLKMQYLHRIFPCADSRKIHLMYDSTMLDAAMCKNIIINLGAGNNGKSGYSAFLKYIMGTYGYKASNELLLTKKPDAASLVNFHQKRIIIFEEPDPTRKIQSATLKEWTGGDEIAARRHYLHETSTKMSAVFHINCNRVPDVDACGEAMTERVIHYTHKGKFVKKKSEVNEAECKWLINKRFQTKSFYDENAIHMFHILIDHYRLFCEQNKEIILNETMLKERDELISSSDGFKLWFEQNYQRTSNKKHCISLEELASSYLVSEHYASLTKQQKRLSALQIVKKELKFRTNIWNFYKRRKVVDGKSLLNVLINYQTKHSMSATFEQEEEEVFRNHNRQSSVNSSQKDQLKEPMWKKQRTET